MLFFLFCLRNDGLRARRLRTACCCLQAHNSTHTQQRKQNMCMLAMQKHCLHCMLFCAVRVHARICACMCVASSNTHAKRILSVLQRACVYCATALAASTATCCSTLKTLLACMCSFFACLVHFVLAFAAKHAITHMLNSSKAHAHAHAHAHANYKNATAYCTILAKRQQHYSVRYKAGKRCQLLCIN